MSDTPALGRPAWVDLTVADAPRVRDFYCAVVGWKASGLDMGGYEDYNLALPGGEPVAGVCHARGPNAGLPPVWMVYFTVRDLDTSLAAVAQGGGRVVAPPRSAGGGARYAVIEDPAGAVCALFQPAAP